MLRLNAELIGQDAMYVTGALKHADDLLALIAWIGAELRCRAACVLDRAPT
jgi:hypothetical protein